MVEKYLFVPHTREQSDPSLMEFIEFTEPNVNQ